MLRVFFFFSIGNEKDLLSSEQRHLAYCKNEKACPLLFVTLVDKLVPTKGLKVVLLQYSQPFGSNPDSYSFASCK